MPRAPVCPFFGLAKKETIVCLRDGADTLGRGELRMGFPDQPGRVRYWADHCCGDWKACTMSEFLAVEYERHGDSGSGAAKQKKASGTAERPCDPRIKSGEWRTPDGLGKLEKWVREGLSQRQIADKCGVSASTIRDWRKQFPEINAALACGQEPTAGKPKASRKRAAKNG